MNVLVAIDTVDSAGFHGIATDLAEATEISSRLAGTMGKVLTIVSAESWPAALDAEVDLFTADLAALKAALEADDLEQARSASEAVHSSQHDLSKAAYAWLTGRTGGMNTNATMPSTLAAIDIVDSTVHGIATDLAEATEISSRLAGSMGKVLSAAQAAAWPADVKVEASQFIADLTALKAALEADDLEQARTASEAVHGSQHDFSKATYGWIEAAFVTAVTAQVPAPAGTGDAGLLTRSDSGRWLVLGLTVLTLAGLAASRLTTRQRSEARH